MRKRGEELKLVLAVKRDKMPPRVKKKRKRLRKETMERREENAEGGEEGAAGEGDSKDDRAKTYERQLKQMAEDEADSDDEFSPLDLKEKINKYYA